MTIEQANRLLISSITGLYDDRESASISALVMDRVTGMQKSKRSLYKTSEFSTTQDELFRNYLSELMRNRPVQYVLEEAWFGTLPFYVDENVLIPRPETEELAEWLLEDQSLSRPGISVLDIGTGSGCISVLLKKKRNDFMVTALDVSEAALKIAKKNSIRHNVPIEFVICDIRNRDQWVKLKPADVIISNPPYIPERQKELIEKHIRDFEPGLALFVPDEDPILFYKIIGVIAGQKLNPGGAVFLEIHHDYAKDIMEWYEKNGFSIQVRKDFSGKSRMIKAGRIL
ncbi:MAG TPA: peptide chain release factor N(5)-glutamine methyltransferase [Puia sp.]